MFDLAQTDKLLATTRSVRRRLDLDRPVEREVLLDCIRLAVQAPTGGNAQTWRWLIVDDTDTKAELDVSTSAWASATWPPTAATR